MSLQCAVGGYESASGCVDWEWMTIKLDSDAGVSDVSGHHVLVMRSPRFTEATAKALGEAMSVDPSTRALVVCRAEDARQWFDLHKLLGRVSMELEFGGARSVGDHTRVRCS